MKINISIDDNLLARVDECADLNYMSRSGFIAQACIQYLNSMNLTSALQNLALVMGRVADSGNLDDDAKRDLADFERMAKMMMSGR